MTDPTEPTTPAPSTGRSRTAATPTVEPTTSHGEPTQAEKDAAALAHEKTMARTRGAPEDAMAEWETHLTWVHSNREDNRVVIYEVDPLHPGGEAFVGGEGPDHVYRTDWVEQLLQSGELIEVPAPLEFIDDPDAPGEQIRNPFYPPQNYTHNGDTQPNMPGQPTRLGRKLNPELWGESDMKEIVRRQSYMPAYRPVPPGGIVPPATGR